MKREVTTKHREVFRENPSSVHFMPGVMPLAGEHIEDAGGQALLLPIQHGVVLAISETKGSDITIYDTLTKKQKVYPLMSHTLDETLPREEKVIHALFNKLHKERGTTEQGYDITIMPTLDNYQHFHLEHAKLLVIAFTLNRYSSWNIMHEKLIKYTNDVYLTYLKGISHKAALMAMLNHTPKCAMVVNAKHYTYEAIPFPFNDYAFYGFIPLRVHDEDNRLYKTHRAMIKQAESYFDKIRDIDTLCDLDLDTFNRFKLNMDDQKMIRYTEHVFYEHTRINALVDTLKDADMDWFEEFIKESQTSLKDLYDISFDDINFLVDTTMANGAITSRSFNKDSRKGVFTVFKKPLDKVATDSFMARFYMLHNASLEIIRVKPNTHNHTL